MPQGLPQLRLAALNIDGVLLNDTFSPVIHHFVVSRGGAYSAAVERRVFSQPQQVASEHLARAVPVSMTGAQALDAYFADRDAYLREHPVRVLDGAIELVRRLRGLGLQTVCYGGLDRRHFDRFLGEWADLFDGPGYVCTNDVRPGLREITTEVFGLSHDQVVFIDDVARVAEAAKELGMAFIGHPSSFEHSFQRALMHEAGVRHLVDSLSSIDETLLRTVDAEAAAGTVWAGTDGHLARA
ncbi:HAD family phosphatase (plasmid) [Streptomyces sp. NBC_01216]|uniref:HAD family hydrolase n=1 Tax=Streptomyces sp. NBC_01216 TaxID=2903778 RepID=UPI002E0D9462|nr:HAD family phosphatase [Streptomyces sp. NBC_01216]